LAAVHDATDAVIRVGAQDRKAIRAAAAHHTSRTPAVPVGVSGSSAACWSASFIFIGTSGSSRTCSPASAHAGISRRAAGRSMTAAAVTLIALQGDQVPHLHHRRRKS
jgi:hypothetical protein